jgi:hypothetical protein
MCPQPFCEYGNIVPHERSSACAQFVKIRSVSTAPPVAESMQRYAKLPGCLFLVNEFRELDLGVFAQWEGSCFCVGFRSCYATGTRRGVPMRYQLVSVCWDMLERLT